MPAGKGDEKGAQSARSKKLKVLYSEEVPRTPAEGDRRTPASISFVPSAAGLIIAGEVIKDIANLR